MLNDSIDDLIEDVKRLRRTSEGLIYSTTRCQAETITAALDEWLGWHTLNEAPAGDQTRASNQRRGGTSA